MVWLSLTIVLLAITFLSFYYGLWIVGIISVLLNISLLWTWKFGAAWDPTPISVVRKILEYLEPKETDVVYDLGCGDGRFIIEAVTKYKCRAVGIEIDPIRYIISKIRIKMLNIEDRAKVVLANFYNYPIKDATIVFCFLTDEANRKLSIKFSKELSNGTIIVSYIWRFYGFTLINVLDNDIFIYMV